MGAYEVTFASGEFFFFCWQLIPSHHAFPTIRDETPGPNHEAYPVSCARACTTLELVGNVRSWGGQRLWC